MSVSCASSPQDQTSDILLVGRLSAVLEDYSMSVKNNTGQQILEGLLHVSG